MITTVPAAPDPHAIEGLTLDAMGCLVALRDPVPVLGRLLAERGIERSLPAVTDALRVEIAYYRSRHLEGRDATSLRALQRDCAVLFLRELDADLLEAPTKVGTLKVSPGAKNPKGPDVDDAFLDGFVSALDCVPLPGVLEALHALDAAGIPMVCVSNWDSGLEGQLQRLGIARYLRGIVSSGTAGFAKPDPRIFTPALELLNLPASRVAHLGDEASDRDGAAAAGLAFLDPPVATLPERLGIPCPYPSLRPTR